MSVLIEVYLWESAEDMMPYSTVEREPWDERITPEYLRDQGDQFQRDLYNLADITDKLQRAGHARDVLDGRMGWWLDCKTEGEAEEYLLSLGLEPMDFVIGVYTDEERRQFQRKCDRRRRADLTGLDRTEAG